MPTPSIETVRAWLDRVMIDRDGNRIGEITDIYLDSETGRPEWAVVRTGLFGLRSTFAPLAEATEVGVQVQVRHQRAQVKDAPNIEPDGQLSQAEEAELYRHDELDYDAVVADSGPPTGTGIGPAGQVAGPGIDEPTGTPPAGADQDTRTAVDQPTGTTGASTLAGSPGGGPADPGSYGQPATPTDQPDSADTDRQDAAGTVEGDHWRRDMRADEAPVAGMTESSRPSTQDPFPAGEGVSQPFVYETPGPPEGGSGIRRRQPGQVRLRRYLVTEVVTETEGGQRHEVRVEREPISDHEVDAVTADPGGLASQSLRSGPGPTTTTGSALRANHDAEPWSVWLPLFRARQRHDQYAGRLDLDTVDETVRDVGDPGGVLVSTEPDTTGGGWNGPGQYLARSLHDLGLATWFGGSLMGAVGLNGAAAVVDQPEQRLRVANVDWPGPRRLRL